MYSYPTKTSSGGRFCQPEEEDPNRLQKQEMQENVEEEMEKVNKDRKKSMNSDATVAVENTEQEP